MATTVAGFCLKVAVYQIEAVYRVPVLEMPQNVHGGYDSIPICDKR